MPKAEDELEHGHELEHGQRYGLMEDERSISGQKRICYCWGYTLRVVDHNCWALFVVIMYPLMYLLGYYSGFISNHTCEGSSII